MPENLYPQLPTAPLMSQESFNFEMVRNTIETLQILKKNIMKSNGSIEMFTTNYCMHLQVLVLSL